MSDSDDDAVVGKQLKVVFLGDKYVGKSCIIRRFCYNEFIRPYVSTIGAEFYIKHMLLPGRREVTLRITDVGGDEHYGTMLDKYLFNANVIILVYDISNSKTFDELSVWIKTIKKVVRSPPIVAILGNKCDLEHQRSVSTQRASKVAKELNVLNYNMSAKTGEAVNAFFMDVVAKYIGIHLTKADKEYQQSIMKAELTTQDTIVTKQSVGRVKNHTLKVTEDGKMALLTLANGDMRKVLNVLQSTWLAYKNVTEDNVYTCVGHPLKSDIENIVKWLLNEDFKSAYTHIKELKTIKGLALNDILEEVHSYIHRIEFPYDILINLLDKMAEIQLRLTSGTNENIQLTALIAAFQSARDITV